MAIYHLSISNVSRSKGSSSIATLSYITGERFQDERLGKTFYGFGRSERVEETGVLLPESAPEQFRDPGKMFNSIEQYEARENARCAKKIVVALPVESSPEEWKDMTEAFIRNNLNQSGYAAVYAIHVDNEAKNPHAHILVPNRGFNKETGEWEKIKTKKVYALDENGERIPIIDKSTGQQKVDGRNRKQWKRVTAEQNPLDQKEFVQSLRESWAKECNQYLAPEQQIDHRSYEERGIDQEPTIHEGYIAREMGERSERIQINNEIRERNSALQKIKDTLKDLATRIGDLVKGEGVLNGRIGDLLQRSRSARVGERAGAEHTGPGNAASGEVATFIRSVDVKEQSATAGRADREAEQQRLRAEAERREAEASRKTLERVARKGKDFSGPSL